MVLSFESLKVGFTKYLEKEQKKHPWKKYNIDDDSKSIFMYSKELKNYLVKELNCDTSIYSKSLNDILSMQIVNGKLVSPDSKEAKKSSDKKSAEAESLKETIEAEKKAAEAEEGETISEDDVLGLEDEELDDENELANDEAVEDKTSKDDKQIKSNLREAEDETKDEDLLTGLLNDLMQDEDFKKAIDTDENDKITDKELAAFFETIKGNDENEKDISIEDILAATEQIKKNRFEIGKGDGDDDEKDADTKKTDTGSTKSAGSSGGSSGGGVSSTGGAAPTGGTTPVSPASSTQKQELPKYDENGKAILENMNSKELKEELKSAESEYAEQQNAYNEAVETARSEDSDKAVSDAKENADKLYEAYEQAIKENAEGGEELAQNITEKKQEVEQKETEIDKNDIEITVAEANIDIYENAYNNANSTVTALEAKLTELRSANKDGELDDTIQELEQAKAEAEAARTEAENNLNAEKQHLEELNQNKTDLQSQLETLNTELEELQSQVPDDGEDGPITKAKEAWEEAQEAYETKKEEFQQQKKDDINTAKDNLKQSDDYVSKVKNALYDTQAKEATDKAAMSTVPDEVKASIDGKLGQGFCAKVEQIAKNLNCSPVDLLAIMHSESGLSPSVVNPNGGATGLIQFMPDTAKDLGTTTEALAQMSAIDQLDYVQAYYSKFIGKFNGEKIDAGDLYAVTFLPARATGDVLCSSSNDDLAYCYNANSSLDINGDGQITKEELRQRAYNSFGRAYGIQQLSV